MSPTDDRLRQLARLTRTLLDELDGGRPDVLSPVDLNRALRQLLRNQIAILERLGGAERVSEPGLRTQALSPRSASDNGSAPRITLRERAADPAPASADADAELRAYDPAPQPDEADDPALRDLSRAEPLHPGELRELQAALGADESLLENATEASLAEEILGESRTIPPAVARSLVEAFDNRDKDYDKGLTKLNRWVGGGSSGTPFQWREDKAYLNLSGLSPSAILRYEKQLMSRMGFRRRLGRLHVPDLKGEVVVYERP